MSDVVKPSRRLRKIAVIGGSGLGAVAVGAGGLAGVMWGEAKLAERRIPVATDDPPVSHNTTWAAPGVSVNRPPIRFAMMGDSTAAGYGVARDRDHAHQIAEHIAANHDISHCKSRNLWAPGAEAQHGTGYRDAKFIIRHGGVTAEVQVTTEAMLAAKKQAHPLMKRVAAIERNIADEGRVATDAEKEEITALQAGQRAIYSQAG